MPETDLSCDDQGRYADEVCTAGSLLYQESGVTARLLLNRPRRCNALSLSLLEALCRRLADLKERTDLRVLLIGGVGTHFCSGLDLSQAVDGVPVELDRIEAEEFLGGRLPKTLLDVFPQGGGGKTLLIPKSFWMPRLVTEVLYRVGSLPQVVVGLARGAALGGGGGILVVCDIALAEPDLQIGFPECRRGLLPTLLHPFLTRRTSTAALYPYLLTGEPVPFTEALRLGLVDLPLPKGALAEQGVADRTISGVVEGVLAGAPEQIRQTKRLMGGAGAPTVDEITDGLLRHWESWNGPAAREGVAAFLEKRAPRW
ncbi:MAG: enoyl-CoA hydratase/isomerase family protein [Thermoguttaceae bacterium]|jgi:methylglutaconyl-CoA hydratase